MGWNTWAVPLLLPLWLLSGLKSRKEESRKGRTAIRKIWGKHRNMLKEWKRRNISFFLCFVTAWTTCQVPSVWTSCWSWVLNGRVLMIMMITITTTVIASFFSRLTTESIRQVKLFFLKLWEVRLQMEYTSPDYFIQYLDPFFCNISFGSLIFQSYFQPNPHVGAELY